MTQAERGRVKEKHNDTGRERESQRERDMVTQVERGRDKEKERW